MKVNQESAGKDALMKMKTVYEANPALGDPRSIESKCIDDCFLILLEKLNFSSQVN